MYSGLQYVGYGIGKDVPVMLEGQDAENAMTY